MPISASVAATVLVPNFARNRRRSSGLPRTSTNRSVDMAHLPASASGTVSEPLTARRWKPSSWRGPPGEPGDEDHERPGEPERVDPPDQAPLPGDRAKEQRGGA